MLPMRNGDRFMPLSEAGYRWIVLGNRNSRRTKLFLDALAAQSQCDAEVYGVSEILDGENLTIPNDGPPAIIRIETLAEQVDDRILVMEKGRAAALSEGSPVASQADIAFERAAGNFSHPLWSRQIYLGMQAILKNLDKEWLSHFQPKLFHAPDDILVMFDKHACQKRFEDAGLRVPQILGTPTDYRQVKEIARNAGRCMLKTSHGSGASGCLALHASGNRLRGITALVPEVNPLTETRWYCCSTTVRTILDESELADLVQRLCQEKCHLETWMPKAKVRSKSFDLRVVCIGQKATHVVARLSSSPFTNLNLLNQRLDLTTLLREVKSSIAEGIEASLRMCEAAARLFPSSLSIGFDVLMDPKGMPALLEANPFGGLLPGTLSNGMDTYTCEVKTMLEQLGAAPRKVDSHSCLN